MAAFYFLQNVVALNTNISFSPEYSWNIAWKFILSKMW